MRVWFVAGVVLLAAAFVAAAAEVAAHASLGIGAGLVSAHELWYALRPGSLIVFQIHVENLHPALWDPVLRAVLALPAWLLLGVPGGALLWAGHPRRGQPPPEDDFDPESLFLYDHLAKQAREDEDFDPREDDMRPDHSLHDGGLSGPDDHEDAAGVDYDPVGSTHSLDEPLIPDELPMPERPLPVEDGRFPDGPPAALPRPEREDEDGTDDGRSR